jgi:arylsulfatase A-like enzyme
MSRSRLSALLWADLKRGIHSGLAACALLVPLELVVTLVVAPGELELWTALRFALLVLALVAILAVPVSLLVGAATAAARVALAVRSPRRAVEWLGLLVPRPPQPSRPVPLAAWIWAGLLVGGWYLAGSYFLTFKFHIIFKAPQVVALLLAGLQLVLFALLAGLAVVLFRGFEFFGQRLRALRWANPFGRPGAALVVLAGLATPGVYLLLKAMPQIRPLIPWRHLAAGTMLLLGLHLAPGLLLRWRQMVSRLRLRRVRLLGALALLAAVSLTSAVLYRVGADPATKYMAVTSSPPLASVIGLIRAANDFDGDGYGSLLGENDCAPFDEGIHPAARDVPDNGVDENCNGRDFSFASRPSYRTGQQMPVPPSHKRPWNILFLTIDDVRYDHTGFGGYKKASGRDLTPNLDALVARSTSFTFCNTPSAGTMATMPAILTSKYFHSGIALNEYGPRSKTHKLIDDSNLLMAEVMKMGGYYTGGIITHHYLDNGHTQGLDTADVELSKRGPRAITSVETTDKAVAWIAKNAHRKWFLWAHYLDPHGYYMPHPKYNFGGSQMDLYDGEIAYTDAQVGRLLRELSRIPGHDRTIIVITSDHGDGFREHGFTNHGMALYREMIHVSLIFYIPDLPPRTVDGVVSPIDVLPTLVDLAGIKISKDGFEGESLIPQLFYDRDAHDRVVFSETNFQRTLRAAITSNHKLIYNLKAQTYELFDLRRDPWEKNNVWGKEVAAGNRMRGYLDDWLERVYYSRDTINNQAALARAKFLLARPPKPRHISRASFEGGAIEVLGFDLDRPKLGPGVQATITVYLRTKRAPKGDYRLQIGAWRHPPGAGQEVFTRSRLTADGLFPTGRWRPGEMVKESFSLHIPSTWTAGKVKLGLRMTTVNGQQIGVTGEHRQREPHTALIGELALQADNKAEPPAGRLIPAVKVGPR